jgi:hypothetical protein
MGLVVKSLASHQKQLIRRGQNFSAKPSQMLQISKESACFSVENARLSAPNGAIAR